MYKNTKFTQNLEQTHRLVHTKIKQACGENKENIRRNQIMHKHIPMDISWTT